MSNLKLVPEKRYCFDTSVLIDLKYYYPSKYVSNEYNFFPSLCEKLEQLINEGIIISHIEVYNELSDGNDELFKWCKKK